MSYHRLVGCLSRGIEGTFSKTTFFLSCFISLREKSQKLLKNHDFKNSCFKSGCWDFSPKRIKQDRQKSKVKTVPFETSCNIYFLSTVWAKSINLNVSKSVAIYFGLCKSDQTTFGMLEWEVINRWSPKPFSIFYNLYNLLHSHNQSQISSISKDCLWTF